MRQRFLQTVNKGHARGRRTKAMSEKKNVLRGKKPYVKPEVEQVPLRPEEAVLGACKVSGGSGLVAGTCGTTCSNAGT
jgi:hypothetical protein